MPPWDAEFQKGERRPQPGAVGAYLEEWGCSGDEGLQNICSKDKGAYSCFGGYMRESASINWMKLKGESWEIFIFNRVQITLALCILKHECKVSFNSSSHICGYRQLEERPFAYLCVCLWEWGSKKNAQSSSLVGLRYVGRHLTQHFGLGTPPEREATQGKSWKMAQLQGILM